MWHPSTFPSSEKKEPHPAPPSLSFLQKVAKILYLDFRSEGVELKELYTSETTLAQKIVLAPLNNEFRFKNLYSTSFMLKNPPEFLKKIHKNQFSASWRGLMVFIYKYKVVYF